MNYTVIFDELLNDPRLAAFAAEARNALPTWFTDQQQAAGDEIRRLGEAASTLQGAPLTPLAPQDLPDWIRLSLIDALVWWLLDTATTCRHSPSPYSPKPVFAVAWKPGLIVCAACTGLLYPPRNSIASATCDGCGHVCAGPATDDGIYTASVILGLLWFDVGLCTDCRQTYPGHGPR
ncbi:hypothetical protein [Actinoplanes rectilineatus]|uniref:hypothetical protein n=1 Tax=Actinoplanes rectilineatus TaxID=113571 RepID=UPI0005F2C9C2|nr:hypothetical protein [Actinoplanes rectilineatus]